MLRKDGNLEKNSLPYTLWNRRRQLCEGDGKTAPLYADRSGLEKIALRAAMIFLSLMLMRTSKKSKTNEERLSLKRRLELWEKGEIRQLSDGAEALQERNVANAIRLKKSRLQDGLGTS